MAFPDAGVYVEFMAPDLRFLVFFCCFNTLARFGCVAAQGMVADATASNPPARSVDRAFFSSVAAKLGKRPLPDAGGHLGRSLVDRRLDVFDGGQGQSLVCVGHFVVGAMGHGLDCRSIWCLELDPLAW